MKKERVLITGAAGFLGSQLFERFLKEGHHMIGMDNLITGDLRNIEFVRLFVYYIVVGWVTLVISVLLSSYIVD